MSLGDLATRIVDKVVEETGATPDEREAIEHLLESAPEQFVDDFAPFLSSDEIAWILGEVGAP